MPADFDINKVIQSGSRQMDLGQLAKLGHKTVRVIDENRIRELITQAVNSVLEGESTDVAARERRRAAERTKSELEARLAQYQAKLEESSGASHEVEKLRAEVKRLQGDLGATTQVIEAEKQRIAAESRTQFDKLLREARTELEAKSGAYEKALRAMADRATLAIPQDERGELPALPAAGADGAAAAAQLMDALNRRVEALSRLSESARDQLAARDQDIALAAAEHRRQELELDRLRKEVDRLREEIHNRERQVDSREHDVVLAAMEQRRLVEENKRLRGATEKVEELNAEIRKLYSERELLLNQMGEFREREAVANQQLASMTARIAEIQGSTTKTGVDLQQAIGAIKGTIGEEIARQIAWAMTAQKTGASGAAIDPGLQLEALFSQKIETNIESVKVEEQKGASVADKLAKLRQARSEPQGSS